MTESEQKSPAWGFAIIPIIPIVFLWRGYVLKTLWAWFIASTFNISPLTIPQALGVSLVAAYLTYENPARDKQKTYFDSFCWYVSMTILVPLMLLFFGWVVKFTL